MRFLDRGTVLQRSLSEGMAVPQSGLVDGLDGSEFLQVSLQSETKQAGPPLSQDWTHAAAVACQFVSHPVSISSCEVSASFKNRNPLPPLSYPPPSRSNPSLTTRSLSGMFVSHHARHPSPSTRPPHNLHPPATPASNFFQKARRSSFLTARPPLETLMQRAHPGADMSVSRRMQCPVRYCWDPPHEISESSEMACRRRVVRGKSCQRGGVVLREVRRGVWISLLQEVSCTVGAGMKAGYVRLI